jgi:N-acetylmuramoyl-L-alanine amidase
MPFHDGPFQPSRIGEHRVALVIGNAHYAHASALSNPVNDAEAMTTVLTRLGFEVFTGLDLNLRTIGDVQGEFENILLENPDVALLFYAGHGLQVDGKNYLIPIDAEITQKAHLASRALLFDDLLDPMAAHASTSIIFLDACRDNPFARNLLRTLDLSISRKPGDPMPTTGPIRGGLARIEKVAGTFIAYATAPDTVAYDGKGPNSPFTGALLKHIEAPGISISDMMIDVRNSVLAETHGRQEPWDQSSLRTRFCFAPKIEPPPLATKMMEAAAEWGAIQHTASLSILLHYRERYQDSPWAEYADMRIAELRLADEARRKAADTSAGSEQTDKNAIKPASGEATEEESNGAQQAAAAEEPGKADEAEQPIDKEQLTGVPSFLGRPPATDDLANKPQPLAPTDRWALATTAIAVLILFAIGIEAWFWQGSPMPTLLARFIKGGEQSSKTAALEGALTGNAKRTRFVAGLDPRPEFEVFSLTGPNRVLVRLPDVKIHLPPQSNTMPVGLVKDFRGGNYAPGQKAIIIDTTVPVTVESAKFEERKNDASGWLVLELVPASGEPISPPLPQPAVSPKARVSATFRPVVVVDPGRGGGDIGKQHADTMEKNLALAFSLELRDRLNATGRYRVLLTRDTDTYVNANERRAFAERNNGSIFISIHAHDLVGEQNRVVIYPLVDASKEAQLAAKRSVLSDANITLGDDDASVIKNVLTDLTLREIDIVPERTTALVQALNAGISAGDIGVTTDSEQVTPFGAPRSAKTPSVLLQLGNPADKIDLANLQSEQWREKVEQAIVTAVDSYFSHQLARLPM